MKLDDSCPCRHAHPHVCPCVVIEEIPITDEEVEIIKATIEATLEGNYQ